MAGLFRRRASKRTAQPCSKCPGSDVESQRPEQNPEEGRVAGENKEEEKAVYKKLMELLEQNEDKRVNQIMVAVEFIVVLGLTAALVCTLKLERIKHQHLFGLRMWQYVTMAIALFGGLSIIRFITWLVLNVILSSRLGLHRDLGYFLRMMKASINVTLWLCFILFAWYSWFRPRLEHRLKRMYGDVLVVSAHQLTRFLIAACLGSALWVGKNALFFWLEADLHYRQLCYRISHTICELHVLQILHNFRVWNFLTHRNEGGGRKYFQDLIMKSKRKREEKVKRPNICEELRSVKRENVPVWILKRLCEEYMKHTIVKPLPVTKHTIQDPEKLMEQALKLFRQMKKANQQPSSIDRWSVSAIDAPSDSDDEEVKLEDLQGRYQVEQNDELELFFKKIHEDSLKGANHQRRDNPHIIGRQDFCSWAVIAYRNYWGLQSTLKSSEKIILKLNRMMMAFVLILWLIIWLLLSDIVDSAQIALLFSPLLGAKFIFSKSTKNMFDGLIFALAMHPFNPGDRVIIEEMELLVTEINILTTSFYKYETGEELVIPNSKLATTPIINLENIPDQSDELEFIIKKDTPMEDIKDLEVKIQMSFNERKDAFNTNVVMKEMGLKDIKMVAKFKYVGCYLTSEVKAMHKSDMLSVIMRLRKEMVENSKGIPPLAGEYTIKITVNKMVKLKQTTAIKEAIGRCMKKFRCGSYDSKVVLNEVTENSVGMNLYVWKKISNGTNEQAVEGNLESEIEKCLNVLVEGRNEAESSNAGSKPCLAIEKVEVKMLQESMCTQYWFNSWTNKCKGAEEEITDDSDEELESDYSVDVNEGSSSFLTCEGKSINEHREDALVLLHDEPTNEVTF